MLLAATIAAWGFLVILLKNNPGELGPGEYIPFVDWFSLLFPAAYALALLALMVRMVRWLGRLVVLHYQERE
jgi:hypothetical protein